MGIYGCLFGGLLAGSIMLMVGGLIETTEGAKPIALYSLSAYIAHTSTCYPSSMRTLPRGVRAYPNLNPHAPALTHSSCTFAPQRGKGTWILYGCLFAGLLAGSIMLIVGLVETTEGADDVCRADFWGFD